MSAGAGSRVRMMAVVGVAALIMGSLGGISAGAAPSAPDGGRILDRTRHGRDALDALVRTGGLGQAAATSRWSPAHLRTELGRDETLTVDPSGRIRYRDVAAELAPAGARVSTSAAPA